MCIPLLLCLHGVGYLYFWVTVTNMSSFFFTVKMCRREVSGCRKLLYVCMNFANLLKCFYDKYSYLFTSQFSLWLEVSYFDKSIVAMSFEAILRTMVALKFDYGGKVLHCVFVYQDIKIFVLKNLIVPEFKTWRR